LKLPRQATGSAEPFNFGPAGEAGETGEAGEAGRGSFIVMLIKLVMLVLIKEANRKRFSRPL